MPISDNTFRISPQAITILRDDRQRTEIDPEEVRLLAASIKRIGLIHPPVVRKDGDDVVLVAGERRLLACRSLGLETIPVRFAQDIPPAEAKVMELEENVKREDLTWTDRCRAVNEIHDLYTSLYPDWNQSRTAEALSLTDGMISQYLRIYPELGKPVLANANTVNQAIRAIQNRDSRQGLAFLEETISIFEAPRLPPPDGPAAAPPPPRSGPRPASLDILNTSFLEWAPNYNGERFTLIHCDFPYGSVEIGPQQEGLEEYYEDTPDIYIALLDCLCNNIDRLLTRDGHILFWYSERMGEWTRTKFRSIGLDLQIHPLIWHHSDGRGISPDTRRRPRHVYDTAMLISRGDAFLLEVISDLFPHPIDRALHPSTKPQPMLEHFFRMFVDQYASVLDPTCGSGSSLRAAESLGAKRVLGLELDPTHHKVAVGALQRAREDRFLTSQIILGDAAS